MNHRLNQWNPFRRKEQSWYGRYFQGKNATWMWPMLGIGLGAGLLYALDPDRGNKRRANARNKTHRTQNVGTGMRSGSQSV